MANSDSNSNPPVGLSANLDTEIGRVVVDAGLATRTEIPSRDTFAAVPPWAWFGGLFGAFYVAISTVVATELGATSLLALALAGQLLMAMVVDHFGWLGLPENPITWVRICGVALLGAGVWLITR